MKLKLGIVGASGRTGSKVVEAVLDDGNFELSAAIVSPESKKLGKVVADTMVQFSSSLEALSNTQGIIDFSRPSVSLEVVKIAAKAGIPCVICTTGHSSEQIELIKSFATSVPIALVSNTSLGVFVLIEIVKRAKDILGIDYDIEIIESHHAAKRDAPSGTAIAIARALGVKEENDLISHRGQSLSGRTKGTIGISSVRGGDVVGEHRVCFLGAGDQLELTHRASGRDVFARGALLLLKRLVEKSPGLYDLGSLYL